MDDARQIQAISTQINKWRESQQLPPLDAGALRKAAIAHINQKGLNNPPAVILEGGEPYFHDRQRSSFVTKDQLSVLPKPESPPEDLTQQPKLEDGSWNPLYKGSFYCQKLGFEVSLTGDIELIAGDENHKKYYVRKIGSGSNSTRYACMAQELTLSTEQDEREAPVDLLQVNLAAWAQIKQFMVNFVSGYPWAKDGDKSPQQVREAMDSSVKSKNRGLAKFIEDERKIHYFENQEDFVIRMTEIHSSFPWSQFAKRLDYIPPRI